MISVAPGGGPSSVWWLASYHNQKPFRLAPKVGDDLVLSVYYDRKGHDVFTATDTTQGTTQTVRVTVGNTGYNQALLTAAVDQAVTAPPVASTRLWHFTATHLTTSNGKHGTLLGPWDTVRVFDSSTGTSTGTVVASPSELSGGGQDFGLWLRALPLTDTQAFAGYQASGGPFRFVATTVTVPAAQEPPANGGSVQVSLAHNGGPTPRPDASIGVLPGGGAGTITYGANAGSGAFTVSPRIGDQVFLSIFYDQHGHYLLTANDLTQHTNQTVTVPALYAGYMPLNSAQVIAVISNSAVVPPPADVRLWEFTGTQLTTYGGTHGSILGPWATSELIDTPAGTPAGPAVMSAPILWNGGHNFGAWLRHG